MALAAQRAVNSANTKSEEVFEDFLSRHGLPVERECPFLAQIGSSQGGGNVRVGAQPLASAALEISAIVPTSLGLFVSVKDRSARRR